MSRLTFESFDGATQARVMQGDKCVLVSIEDRDYRPSALPSIVLTPAEARSLGRRIIRAAGLSEKATSKPDEERG